MSNSNRKQAKLAVLFVSTMGFTACGDNSTAGSKDAHFPFPKSVSQGRTLPEAGAITEENAGKEIALVNPAQTGVDLETLPDGPLKVKSRAAEVRMNRTSYVHPTSETLRRILGTLVTQLLDCEARPRAMQVGMTSYQGVTEYYYGCNSIKDKILVLEEIKANPTELQTEFDSRQARQAEAIRTWERTVNTKFDRGERKSGQPTKGFFERNRSKDVGILVLSTDKRGLSRAQASMGAKVFDVDIEYDRPITEVSDKIESMLQGAPDVTKPLLHEEGFQRASGTDKIVTERISINPGVATAQMEALMK